MGINLNTDRGVPMEDNAQRFQPTPKQYALIQRFRMMDDDFMVKVFDGETACTALLLNIILERTDLRVEEAITQREYKGLQGRSVRLDIVARDSENQIYDIEVQRADRGAGVKRARFHSSMLDTKLLQKNEDFTKLVETYVIFITENDVLEGGLPIYHIVRKIEETGASFKDGTNIIYVNGENKNISTPLGKLIHDFYCTDARDVLYPELAERIRFLKETEGGQRSVCKLMEELENDKATEIALRMLARGKMTVEEIAEDTGLSVEQVEALKNQKSA
jgi:hypothetical protein